MDAFDDIMGRKSDEGKGKEGEARDASGTYRSSLDDKEQEEVIEIESAMETGAWVEEQKPAQRKNHLKTAKREARKQAKKRKPVRSRARSTGAKTVKRKKLRKSPLAKSSPRRPRTSGRSRGGKRARAGKRGR